MTTLELVGDLHGGYFLDVGAGQGIVANNTYVLEKERGWSGLCIEPLPGFFQDLLRTRNCRCRQAVVGPVSGPARFALAKGCPWSSGLLEHYNQPPRQDFQMLDVNTVTIAQVLDEEKAPAMIDYWSLDIEGSELAVLETFPWDRRSVRFLCVEHNAYLVGTARREELRSFLLGRGFRIVAETEADFYAIGP